MANNRERNPLSDEAISTAAYIAAMADELVRLAKSHNLDALAYILQMARLEAEQISRASPGHGFRPQQDQK
jgi:hypothetical protein